MNTPAWKAVIATAAILGCTQMARADLNINGETGLFLNPTAAVVQKDRPQIQGNYYDLGSDYKDEFFGLYGAISPANKLEISAGIDRFNSSGSIPTSWDRNGFDVGAKYQLFTQQQKGFSLAVGAGYDRGLLNNIRVYAAASKAFNGSNRRAPVIGTLGVRWDRFDDVGLPDSSSQASVYAGLEVPVVSSGELSAIGEIQSKNTDGTFGPDEKFAYAVGLRYHPKSQAFSISAGVARQGINTPWENNSRLFVQVGYTFGK